MQSCRKIPGCGLEELARPASRQGGQPSRLAAAGTSRRDEPSARSNHGWSARCQKGDVRPLIVATVFDHSQSKLPPGGRPGFNAFVTRTFCQRPEEIQCGAGEMRVDQSSCRHECAVVRRFNRKAKRCYILKGAAKQSIEFLIAGLDFYNRLFSLSSVPSKTLLRFDP